MHEPPLSRRRLSLFHRCGILSPSLCPLRLRCAFRHVNRLRCDRRICVDVKESEASPSLLRRDHPVVLRPDAACSSSPFPSVASADRGSSHHVAPSPATGQRRRANPTLRVGAAHVLTPRRFTLPQHDGDILALQYLARGLCSTGSFYRSGRIASAEAFRWHRSRSRGLPAGCGQQVRSDSMRDAIRDGRSPRRQWTRRLWAGADACRAEPCHECAQSRSRPKSYP